jgi:ketosteroid isomerase-like protein
MPDEPMPDKPTEASLVQANARFYETFEELDYQAMAALWEHSDRVYCCHPGWSPLRGARPVLESWKRIIENTTAMAFTLDQVEARIDGNIGIVTLYESINSRVGHERHSSTTAVTNLFAFDTGAGAWKIFHHHASHAAISESPEGGMLN